MSNGSERTPERCVHAPDGPDWAGLREPSSWKERALAAEAQLDGMTVEWGVGGGSRVLTADSEKTARSAAAMHASTPLVNRLVSPWAVVEGDDQ